MSLFLAPTPSEQHEAPAPTHVEMVPKKSSVTVTNIFPEAQAKDLVTLFSECGAIEDLQLSLDESRSDNFQKAIVTFSKSEEAETAEMLTGAVFLDFPIQVTRISPEALSHSPEAVSDREWRIVKTLGSLTGKGCVLGQQGVDYLTQFNEKHAITKTITTKAHEIDERAHISASISLWSTDAKQRWEAFHVKERSSSFVRETDDKYKLSESISSVSKSFVDKINSNETITKGVAAANETITTTSKAISEKIASSEAINKGKALASRMASNISKEAQAIVDKTKKPANPSAGDQL